MSSRIGFAFVLLVVAFGCAQRRVLKDVPPQSVPWHDARHWIHDQELRKIMATLVERQALDSDPVRHDRCAKETATALEDAAGYAQALAQATDDIRGEVREARMSRADRAAFAAQVDTLEEQASALAVAARSGDIEAMRRIIEQIGQTCNACHTRFRDYSGLLEPTRKADTARFAPSRGTGAIARQGLGRPERLP